MRRALTVCLVIVLATSLHARQPQSGGTDLFQKALSKERAEGQLDEAIALYERIVIGFTSDRPVVARALIQLGSCYERLGRPDARSFYERVVREFADQRGPFTQAQARLAVLAPGAGGT